MLTIIIAQWDDTELLECSLNSILKDHHSFHWNLNIIINQMVDSSDSMSCIEHYIKAYPNVITSHQRYSNSLYNAYQKSLKFANSKYTMFLMSGDTISQYSLAEACDYFECEKVYGNCHILALNTLYYLWKKTQHVYFSDPLLYQNNAVLNLNEHPTCVPTDFFGYLFKTEVLKNHSFNSNLKYDAGIDLIYQLLLDKPAIAFVPAALYRSVHLIETKPTLFFAKTEYDWYFKTFTDMILPTYKSYQKKYQFIPDFIQYAALYQLKWRYAMNANNGNKHIIDESLDDFFKLSTQVMEPISETVLFNTELKPKYKMTQPLRYALLYLKYKNSDISDLFSKVPILAQDVYLNKQKVYIELMEYQNKQLTIEASIDTFITFEKSDLHAILNGKHLLLEETYRYAHSKFFGVSSHKRYTFRFVITLDDLCDSKNNLMFFFHYNGAMYPMRFITRNYNAKVDTKIKNAYWTFDQYMVQYKNDNLTLSIHKYNHLQLLLQECKFSSRMLFGSYRSRKMFVVRLIYWISHPFFKQKNIWLTYDKLYKGGDCGEYLYKYMCSRTDQPITPVYIMNADCDDFKRLQKEGYQPLKYNSLKHRLYYLNSSVVFTTHGGVHSFNAFTNKQITFMEGLLHHDVACIQHGLTVQQLAFNSNRLFNNMKRYYCASKYEIQNLSHPIYGYEDKSILKLTGIPRYDGLINQDKHQILITPTWRNYIAMPAASKNNAKPYNPDFIHTDYFKIYNALLSDTQLIATAKETGYQLIYLLHPAVSAQIDDYPQNQDVKIIPSLSVNYEKILTESSLMVTDYSGVQFDFAYMRKPVIYYHPPKLPPHYKEGGFFYDTMGFGEICTEHGSLVNTLCEYMKNHCEVKPFYREREDDFFAHSDLNSCQRIFDDMLEFQHL